MKGLPSPVRVDYLTHQNRVGDAYFQSLQITRTGHNIPCPAAKGRVPNPVIPLRKCSRQPQAGATFMAWHYNGFRTEAEGMCRKTRKQIYIRNLLDYGHLLHVKQHTYKVGLSTKTTLNRAFSAIRGRKKKCNGSTHVHRSVQVLIKVGYTLGTEWARDSFLYYRVDRRHDGTSGSRSQQE